MRTVIVGIRPDNPREEPLSVSGEYGRFISDLLGVPSREYTSRFDRINIRSTERGRLLSAVNNLFPILRGRRVIALGEQVRRALEIQCEKFDWDIGPRYPGFVGTWIPHPNSRNLYWTDEAKRIAAKSMKRWDLPCIHLEGPDGSGKTHLLESLLDQDDRFIGVGTEGPVKTPNETYDRIRYRISPGSICDRSSGLISELIYGPVLRSGTLVPEEVLWGIVQSLKYAVTFVYCRPDTFTATVREGEDDGHLQGTIRKHTKLVDKYDEVFGRLESMGARVIRYNWQTQDIDDLKIRLGISQG